jgi:hypothetical protein
MKTKEQKKWNRKAAKAGRQAYKSARKSGASVKSSKLAYTREFLKIWKISSDGRKTQTEWTNSLGKKAANRRYLYGLSDILFRAMLRAQKNRCAICRKKFVKTPFVDHKKGIKTCRGLLCSNCNFLIGLAHEDIKILLSAIRYLKRKEV